MGKVNDVVEDANWRQRINAETEAAECWRHEWGFLLSQNGEEAGLSNTFTERARTKMKEMEAAQAGRDEEMDASVAKEKAEELFLKTFKKKHKEFPKYVSMLICPPHPTLCTPTHLHVARYSPPHHRPWFRGSIHGDFFRLTWILPLLATGQSRRSSLRSRCSPPTSTDGTVARSSASGG